MKEAPNPHDEAARLKALLSYDILDTPPEPEFDDLTALASNICQTPIALISLIDSSRQWFKSTVGLTVRETTRQIAFCSHAILQQNLFTIFDACEDERFVDNPLVMGEPHIRFYAGAPLRTAEGYTLGTLCVIGQTPKELSQEQRQALSTLSRQVVAQLELRKHCKERERLVQELRVAVSQRERLSENLHDNLMQTLYAIGLQLDMAKSLASTAPVQASTKIAGAIEEMNGLIGHVRGIICYTDVESMTEPAFMEALQKINALLNELGPTRFEFEINARTTTGLSGQQRFHLYHIIRNALINVVKHARAKTCKTIFTWGKKGTRLEVHDDGIGFAKTKGTASGTGIINMASRARQIGARLEIRSARPRGTKLLVTIPQ